jgi:hypothetical protein
MRRSITTLSLTMTTLLLAAAPAMAGVHDHDNGEGLVGETNDKIITFFSLGVLLFFITVAIVGTVIQSKLESRKDAKKAARLRGRTGW